MQKFLTRCGLLALAFINLALAQLTQAPHAFAPGACGPVDRNYIRVAEDTGGMPLFFQRSEVAQSMKFVQATSTQNHVTLLWAKGEPNIGSREFLVPVDSTLEQLVFTFSTDTHGSNMQVLGADDRSFAESPQGEVTDFTCGRYIVVKKPLPGTYRIRIQSSGRFWVSAAGKSDIFLHAVEFVEPGGRRGHQGMFPIHGQPLSGRPANLQASLDGQVEKVRFALVTPENRMIRSVDLRPVENRGDSRDFAGTFPLPNEPFRLVVTGTDQTGAPFERVHEAVFRPTTISLVLVNQERMFAGLTSRLTFQATNLGNADSFHVRVVCAKGWRAEVDPAAVSLAQGETAKLVVTVSVPAGAPAYGVADLVLTASSDNDPLVNNGVVYELTIEPPRK